ncbi:MAG: hypothetical protein CMH27_04740 [Micavibrio sp.]|nr:hypothetical protein [Micavibrio sp.]|tara:strand:- start:54 stop:851 length:798 start_codon:yes stop_codon:yes gene_type:complete
MKIIHLSDLHFGTHEGDIAHETMHSIGLHNADLIVISGDFTQLGNKKEFTEARNFLKALQTPYFCIPGNHDIPQHNLFERFFHPYRRYKTYIHDDLCPVYEDKDIILGGLNSARRALLHWNWANGAISSQQLRRLTDIFDSDTAAKRWRICTFHHPVHKVQDMPMDVTVFGGNKAMQTIQALKIDLVLTGHVHHASITSRGDETHQCIYLSASTAMSSRRRGHENGYNVISLNNKSMQIEIYARGQDGFYKTRDFETFKDNTPIK